ncbi:MAG: myo-inositol-1(or 4)-monophosphatase [Acidimicrobiales bacterium]
MSTQPNVAENLELLALASACARDAGELVETMRVELVADGITEHMETKSSSADVVTAADRAAERTIIDGILAARPDDSILGEEGGDRAGSTGIRWLIDPIDGTTNYLYDIPAYSVSIAAENNGVLVAGAVYEPRGNTLYAAAAGAGATRNGQPIRCTGKSELETSLIATGFGYVADRRRGQAEVLLELLPLVRDIRRFGSAALDLCFVASGLVDGYYERGLNPWDLAAGALIASEAGAIVGDLRGGDPSPTFVLASAPNLFPALRDHLIDLAADQRP